LLVHRGGDITMSEHDNRTSTESAAAPPAGTDNRVRPHLPMTAEVGGEGGSYADPTYQVATFEGDLPTSRGTAAAAPAQEPEHGMLRYPTEDPDAPPASARRAAGPNWRAGAVGAAAGALAVIGVELLRRNR
jgi:hypothetical protein